MEIMEVKYMISKIKNLIELITAQTQQKAGLENWMTENMQMMKHHAHIQEFQVG